MRLPIDRQNHRKGQEEPPTSPGPVVAIIAFEVPEQEDEAFLRGSERTREFLRTQPGYLSMKLHRGLSPQADFRFIEVAYWESQQAFRDATSRPEFRKASVPFRLHASLYEVVHEDEP